MRWANLLLCCLFLVFTLVGASAPLGAADLKGPRQNYPEQRALSDEELREKEADYCYAQRKICRKICYLRDRFDDRFNGCPNSCDSRETRCVKSGCYRWSEQEFLIAERFGGYKCFQ
jgi:hypothetical protein